MNIAGDRANWLMYVGRSDEALRCLDSAQQRDPYPPTWVWEVRGSILYDLRRYEEAIAAYQRVPAQHPWMPALLAAANAQAGRLDHAHRELAHVLRARPNTSLRSLAEKSLYTHQGLLNHWLEGLRRAGLPE